MRMAGDATKLVMCRNISDKHTRTCVAVDIVSCRALCACRGRAFCAVGRVCRGLAARLADAVLGLGAI